MAFTYSGDPSRSAKDAVRFLIGDTDPQDASLQDAEIKYLLDQCNQAPLNAAVRATESMIAKASRMTDESVGQVKIMYSQRAKGLRDLLGDLRRRLALTDCAPYAGGIRQSDMQSVASKSDRVAPAFTDNLMQDRVDGSAEPDSQLEQIAWGNR